MRGVHNRVCNPSFDFVNPIIDTGAPTSTGGTEEAAKLCQILGIQLNLSPPRAIYQHGWGTECAQAQHIRHTWYLTLFDINGLPTTIAFDLVNGSSPLIIGLDVKRFGNTINIGREKVLQFKRPQDNRIRTFVT